MEGASHEKEEGSSSQEEDKQAQLHGMLRVGIDTRERMGMESGQLGKFNSTVYAHHSLCAISYTLYLHRQTGARN